MKTAAMILLAMTSVALAQKPEPLKVQNVPEAPLAPAPIFSATTAAMPSGGYVYEQKAYAGRSYLISPEQAQGIIEKFKGALAKANTQRFVVYVNRELVDDKSGLKLTSRREDTRTEKSSTSAAGKTDGGSTTETVKGENRYRVQESETPTLADKQTVRDLERLFGRPMRAAGVKLVDQRVAAQMLSEKPLENYLSAKDGQAAKDREVLKGLTDIVIEVLITSKNVTVPEVSGDRTYVVPDLQATAIRLSDSQIVGQATAAELTGRGSSAGFTARQFDVHDIAEATSLLLMQDMATSLDK